MIGLVFFAAVIAALVLLDLAADRWGVDSRTMSSDGRTISLFTR
jgi:hypothetical protein